LEKNQAANKEETPCFYEMMNQYQTEEDER
jgi:hypothetical protein